MNRTKHNKFNDLRLEFELKTYEARVKYLKGIKEDFEKGKGRRNPKDHAN